MNVLIKISDEIYRHAKEGSEDSNDEWDTMRAVANGILIPDNATNGDVIKAMFPNLKYKYTVIDEYTNEPTFVMLIDEDIILTNFSMDWWNALYQRGDKDERNNSK